MTIDLQNQTWLACWLSAMLVFQTAIGFTMYPALAPLVLFMRVTSILNFLLVSFLYIRKMEMNGLEMLLCFFLLFLCVFTLLSGTYLAGAIHRATEVLILCFTLSYFKEHLDAIMKSIAFAFSVCIYLNSAVMILFPDWMIAADDAFLGFLLGGNYNQMGGRMLPGIVFSCLCASRSKWWVINTIALFIVCIFTLGAVGSMTSVSALIVFALFCIIPSQKLLKIAVVGAFSLYVLFQVFVVFSGEDLHNNDLAVYLIQDVLGKDMTFTDRTTLWDIAGEYFMQSPLIGYGYVDVEWYASNFVRKGPHNFIYSILIQGGLVLIVNLILIMYISVSKVIADVDRTSLVVIMGTVVLLIMMLMEVYPFLFLFMLLAIIYYYPEWKEQTRISEIKFADMELESLNDGKDA